MMAIKLYSCYEVSATLKRDKHERKRFVLILCRREFVDFLSQYSK